MVRRWLSCRPQRQRRIGGMQVMMHSATMGVANGCTPGYYNLEGDLECVPGKYQRVLARSGIWGLGIEHWLEMI